MRQLAEQRAKGTQVSKEPHDLWQWEEEDREEELSAWLAAIGGVD